MMKNRLGLVLAFGLSGLAGGGCGVPVVVAVASYAADGMSLIGTGKTITDHALSAVADEDCAMWRVIRSEAICVAYAGETVVAEAEAAPLPGAEGAPPVSDGTALAPKAAAQVTEAEIPPPMRALLTVPDPVPPPRTKPVQLAEVPAPARRPPRP